MFGGALNKTECTQEGKSLRLRFITTVSLLSICSLAIIILDAFLHFETARIICLFCVVSILFGIFVFTGSRMLLQASKECNIFLYNEF